MNVINNTYNYSVIIPFRDCTELLRTACASIPVRDDIQIIVIDNAENPIGASAIKDFGNPNIEYFTSSPIKGAGCARNVGLDNAKGKYLLFLDADDYFTQGAFDIFDQELDSDIDVIYFNATSIKIVTGKPSNRHIKIDKLVKEAIKSDSTDRIRYYFINPVCKMVRKQLVDQNQIKFQEVKVSNDVMFSTKVGHFADKVKAVDRAVYVITEGEADSSLTKTKSAENQFIRFQVAIEHYLFLKSVNRLDMTFRLMGFIGGAIRDFGLLEGLRWCNYALKRRINIFR